MPNLLKFGVFPPFAKSQAEMFLIYEHFVVERKAGLAIFTIATSRAFPTEHGKTPQTYYIGVHDNSLFKKLEINTKKFTIRRDVS